LRRQNSNGVTDSDSDLDQLDQPLLGHPQDPELADMSDDEDPERNGIARNLTDRVLDRGSTIWNSVYEWMASHRGRARERDEHPDRTR
jgi:hypothetical protein